MKKLIKNVFRDEGGDAVVEATFLFPIMIMIFFAMILLAMYLPTSVALQRSVEKAALIVSAQRSDLGYVYDLAGDTAGVNFDKLKQENVYTYQLRGFGDEIALAGRIVEKYAADALYAGKNFSINIQQDPNDKRYILIKAEQVLELPFDFPILPISNAFEIKQTARVMIRDADEFIRGMDIVYDVFIKNSDKVKKTLGEISNIVGAINKIKSFFKF